MFYIQLSKNALSGVAADVEAVMPGGSGAAE
jgi:hypothetical protein